MPLPILVTAYSGYKPNDRPCTFVVDEELYYVHEVLERWYELDHLFFKVLTTNGKKPALRT
jgi:hypothetical protein